jgi:hypothetical protein
MTTPRHGRGIDAILGEERQDIALLPGKVTTQAGAELFGGPPERGIGVIAAGDGTLIEDWDEMSVSFNTDR